MDPRILDAKGREIRVGDRVLCHRYGGAHPRISPRVEALVTAIQPPWPGSGFALIWLGCERHVLAHVRSRCPDLQLLDDREESSNGN